MPPSHTQVTVSHSYHSGDSMMFPKTIDSPPPSPLHTEYSFPGKSWPKYDDLLETASDSGHGSLSSLSSSSSHESLDGETQKDVTFFNISIAKEAVCAMGIPEHLVQQVIDNRRLDCGTEFTSTTELYIAVEEIAQSPEKQAELARKLYLAEELEKQQAREKLAKEELEKQQARERLAKEVVLDGSCFNSPESARLSAEMPRVAASEKASVDKCQLKERVRHLTRENQKLRDRKMCRACKKVELATSGITFLPCGHFITCEQCSEMFDDCLACGKNIMGTVRTFLS